MGRLLFYILLIYIGYRIIKYWLKKIQRRKQSGGSTYYTYYDEYGNRRIEKDITQEARIIEEKTLNSDSESK